jgi:hypothetical protein
MKECKHDQFPSIGKSDSKYVSQALLFGATITGKQSLQMSKFTCF